MICFQFQRPQIGQSFGHPNNVVHAAGEPQVLIGHIQRSRRRCIRSRSVEVRRLELAVQSRACRPDRSSFGNPLQAQPWFKPRSCAAARVHHRMHSCGPGQGIVRTAFQLNKGLNQSAIHVGIPASVPIAQRIRTDRIWHRNERPHAVLEGPHHRVGVHPKAKGRCAFVCCQLSIGVHRKRHPVLDKTVGHQRTRLNIFVCITHEIACDIIVVAVLAITAHSQRGFDVHFIVHGLGLGDPHHAHARSKVLVPIIVSIDVALRSKLV